MSSKTKLVVFLEYALITIDILCNALSDFVGRTIISRLSSYVLQDLCLILSLIIFFLLFFRKKILQQRLLTCLLKENWITFVTTLSYLTLTVTLQSLTVTKMATVIREEREMKELKNSLSPSVNDIDEDDSGEGIVSPSFWMNDNVIIVFFVLHRMTSALYYFSYRNSTANLHDSKFIQHFKNDSSNSSSNGTGGGPASTSLPSMTSASSISATSSLTRYPRPSDHLFTRQ